jgi:hypothetical protein
MPRTEQPLVLYDPALPEAAQRELARTGPVDIIVGIPSHRNGRTIGEVVDALVEGIATYLPDQRVLLMNADGGSSDNTCRFVEEVVLPANATRLVTAYEGGMGKGNGIRAILEAAALSGARACAIVEARCPGITAEWLPALVHPVLSGNDLAVAAYDRSPQSQALTDNLAYPFVRLFFNADLREPLAGEFCVSGDLARDLVLRDVWETDVARFGVNVWLTMQALADNRRVVQVDLGYRGDAHCEPGSLADLRFLHAVGTQFRYLTTHRAVWQQEPPERPIPFQGPRSTGQVHDGAECIVPLVEGFREGGATLKDMWEQVLSEETLEAVNALLKAPPETLEFSPALWANVLIEFAVVYNRGEGDPDRVVEALLPLFYGRAATYVRQAQGRTREEREALAEEVVRELVERRPLMKTLWSNYRPWIDPTGYFVGD